MFTKKPKRPILVTGAHRSGTTWVGRMLSQSPSVGYIHEPFNPNHRPGICAARFDYWFPYISNENGSIFYKQIKNTVSFSYNLIGEFRAIRRPEALLSLLRNYGRFLLYRISNVRPLLKDPIAVFSAEWLVSTFDMEVIVLIRHPAAFAGSLKQLNWTYPFSHFLEQPLLMRDHLYPFESEIREYSYREHNIIDQAILLWKIIHHVIIEYQKNHDDWIFMRHEDLSRDPLCVFQTLFSKLNLEFSEHIREVIVEHSDSSNPVETKGASCIKRDSESNIWNWKSRLTVSDIGKIRDQVEDISSVFYSDEDW